MKTNENDFLKRRVIPITVGLLMLLLFNLRTEAQTAWSLTHCINYALKNNIDLTISHNNIETQQVNLQQSKAALLPDLNLGSQVNMNFGRNIDPNTNDVTFNKTMQNYYWANTSVNIFQGLVKMNTLKLNSYRLAAGKEEAQFEKNKLIFKVLSSYFTVLYTSGLVDVAENQVHISEKQIKRMQKFVEVGRESPLTVQELKSQWANDKLTLTRAENLYSKTLLELKQLLRLEVSNRFDIDTTMPLPLVTPDSPNVDSLFARAVNSMPQILQQKLLYNASLKELSVAKGYISPRLYLSAGYSTNFFDGAELTFAKQLENNQNQWVNMSISIPVFNNASVHSRIKRKKIAVDNQKLKLQKERETLYTEIWKAADDLKSAKNEFYSAVELKKFSELSLKNITEKMEKGLASATDYDIAKQRYISAKATLLKAKLVYILRSQMLEFYRRGNWNHLLNN